MITVSLAPTSFKRVILLATAIGFLSSISCFAKPLLLTVHSTPYDNQMGRIRPILQKTSRSSDMQVSLNLVNRWIGDLRSIPYGFSQIWKTPAELEKSPIADCKGKSVALYEKMQLHGATNVRLIIGKRTPSSRSTHAWLEWSTTSGAYVLDPTINWMAYKVDQIGGRAYVPLYAYAGSRKYRAVSSTLVAQN
jgi:predicted transglutaminase-like cysteine proteinase